ncbi:MAG: HEAT repeat domain-containing protein [Thermoanaerobaculia bacterium]
MTDDAPPPAPPHEPFEESSSSSSVSSTPAGRLLVQFFLIPAFVVGIAVFVFWLFGTLAVDRKTPAELLSDVRTGSRNQRWQAAFDLTKKLPAMKDPAEKAAFAAAAMQAFAGAGSDDPRVRRYLTLVLGRLGDPRAVPLLEGALSDKDAETRLYALWALALIGDPKSAPKVRPLLDSEDAGVRKTAAFAVGRMEDGEAIPRLRRLLADAVLDVRWNAALALATLDDPSGRDVLVGMCDRAALRRAPGLTAEQQEDALLNGLRGLTLLKDAAARTLGSRMADADPSLRVRREARRILEAAPR